MLTFTEAQNLGSLGVVLLCEPIDSRYPFGTVAYKGEFGSRYQVHVVELVLNGISKLERRRYQKLKF